jgi:CHAD domain-containing protein
MARVTRASRVAKQPAGTRPWPESFAEFGRAVLAARVEALGPFLKRDVGQLPADEIHRFRVAVRRLRSSLRLLRSLGDNRLAVAETQARRVMRALGAVRDLDETLRKVAPRGKIATDIRRRREAALRAERQTFGRRAAGRWAQQLSALASEGAGRATSAGKADGRAMAAALIRRGRRRLKRQLARLDRHAPLKRFHVARRRTKQFADALDDVSPYVGPVARPLRRDVQRLRSALGRLQDAAVMKTALVELGRRFSRDRTTHRRLLRLSADNRTELRRARLRCLKVAKDRSTSHWRRVRKALGPPADPEPPP